MRFRQRCRLLGCIALCALGALGAFCQASRSRPRLTCAFARSSGPDTWWWHGGPGDESEEEMTVYVPIPENVPVTEVVVEIRPTRLFVGLKNQKPLLEGPLWKEIKAPSLSHSVDYDHLLKPDADQP
ncbi:unnamed protein product [Effrenium voratum]|nr:unnamed protein product [Effrenium voratum]